MSNHPMQGIALKKVTVYSTWLMVLTSVHHVYGAFIYNTPWRLHALALSVPMIIVSLWLYNALRGSGARQRHFLSWLYWTLVLTVSIGLIGLFEGAYNHLLKNVLFFLQTDPQLLSRLFPPPTYEMPNDLWFEISGVLQGIIAAPLIIHFVRWTRCRMATCA